MPRYRPKELREFLASRGLEAKKGLSQNFLIDGNIIRKIVEGAGIQPGDTVLEIGPGPGALTEALINAGAKVTAVEMDKEMAEQLQELDVKVHCSDILDFDLDQLEGPIKVVANLPYHITTPILAKLLTRRDKFTSVTVMVQEEVGRRMVASPGSKVFGHLTLFLSFYSDVHYLFKVGHNCFYPKPKVDSAVVQMVLKKPPLEEDLEGFFKMTRKAFEQRRKMLRKSLSDLYPTEKVIEAMKASQIQEQARPEELSLDDLLRLWRSL